MSVPFRIGYCINCGAQTYARNFRGALMGAFPGTKLFWLVLYDDFGRECRVGTLTSCANCDPAKFNIEEIKKSLFESAHVSGVSGNEPEWKNLHHARIEIVQEFKGGPY